MVEEAHSRRKAFGAGRSDPMKNAAQACDTAWGCSPTRVPATVSRSSVFPGCGEAFRSESASSTVNAVISTAPFASVDSRPIDLLRDAGIHVTPNPYGRWPTEAELCDLVRDADLFIAGTEPITDRVMAAAPRLRLISRVGIGLDNVDLSAARRRNIAVSYTPDAPAPAVAELTIALMLSLLRHVHNADRLVRSGGWHRFLGRRLGELTVGIIGIGRVGRRVVDLLQPFGARVLANDV